MLKKTGGIPANIAKLIAFVQKNPGLDAAQLKQQKCPQRTRIRLAEQAGFIQWYENGWYVGPVT